MLVSAFVEAKQALIARAVWENTIGWRSKLAELLTTNLFITTISLTHSTLIACTYHAHNTHIARTWHAHDTHIART